MNRQEFEIAMGSLRKTYGVNKYPNIRSNIFYLKFKNVDISVFERTVNKLIACETYAPMFDKFTDALKKNLEFANAKDRVEKLKDVKVFCEDCKDPDGNNLGHIYRMHYNSDGTQNHEIPCVYQCSCELGPLLRPSLPVFKGV